MRLSQEVINSTYTALNELAKETYVISMEVESLIYNTELSKPYKQDRDFLMLRLGEAMGRLQAAVKGYERVSDKLTYLAEDLAQYTTLNENDGEF